MAKTLLIGCGGTGIKALVSFNKQMAGDPERRHKMWEEVSYLVIDTNQTDIGNFEKSINDGMEFAGGNIRPIVKAVHITDTNALLNDIVHKYIVQQTDENELAQLRKNWWFSPDEKQPYTAIYRRDTGDGAAQCPPIAYMFMWEYLPRLEAVIDSLLNEIVARNSEEINPLSDLQVYLVAGLCGGTGRGTWNLVAFKIRECILRRVPNARVDLPAIFLDSSCYADLTPNAPDKNIPKQVNAVTGWSELSAWLSIRDVRSCYNYSLPALREPHAPKMPVALLSMADVIHVQSETNDPYFQSPVRYAYMVFADNGRQKLYVGNGRNEYCNMVGVALYALVAHSYQFRGDMCNGLLKYCSFGATSAEIETVDLQKFFNFALRKVKVDDFRSAGSEEERDTYRDKLLSDFKLRQTEYVNADYIARLSPNSDKKDVINIVEQLRSAILNNAPVKNPDTLKDSIFDKQNYKSVLSKMKKVVSTATLKSEIITSHINNLLTKWSNDLETRIFGQNEEWQQVLSKNEKKLTLTPLSRYLWQLVLGAYRYNGEPSIARALLCIESLLNDIKETKSNLDITQFSGSTNEAKESNGASKTKNVQFNSGSENLYDTCKTFATNQLPLFTPYNSNERKILTSKLISVYENEIYNSIRNPLMDVLDKAIDILMRWKGMLSVICSELESVSNGFELMANKTVTGSENKSAYDQLFVKTDIQSIIASIPVGTETAKKIRRIFKPIMSRENIKDLLSKKELSYVGANKIEDSIKEEFIRLLSIKADKPSDEDITQLHSNLTNIFQTNVSINTAKIGAEFTLEGVLRRNIVHWNRALDDAHNRGADAERELQDRFRSYLGLRDDGIDGYDYILSSTGAPHMLFQNFDGLSAEGVNSRLPVSLMVNCEPWILFDLADERLGVENLQKTVLLPYSLSFSSRENIKSEIKKHDTRRGGQVLDVLDPSEDAGRFNPADRIVAFSSVYAPLDANVFNHIVSLQHDITDPSILQRLLEAEQPEGKGRGSWGYFEKQQNKNNKGDYYYDERPTGLGFVSPVFVNEPELDSRRWKPWKDVVDKDEEKVRNNNLVYEVLAYAFTCSGMALDSSEMAEITNEGWSFPLLGRSSNRTRRSGKFLFKREALGIPYGEISEWRGGDLLPCTGITEIVNWLMGKGKPDANGKVDSDVTAMGVKVFKQLVAEKKYFDDNIRGKFKPAFWQSIKDARISWLTDEATTKAKISQCDRDTWKMILKAASSEK